tara:strand:+ start:1507 stop:2841 length:1335 start_codon:yes stop_codon:yes gene_type:complete
MSENKNNLGFLLGAATMSTPGATTETDRKAAQLISQFCSNGQFIKAGDTFHNWAASRSEGLLDEAGESDVQNAMDGMGAALVIDAWQKCGEKQRKFNKENTEKSSNIKKSKTPKSSTDKSGDETSKTKKAVETTGTIKDQLQELPTKQANDYKGVNGDPLIGDGAPAYIPMSGDVVQEGKHNSRIVLGRDRPASRASGKGGGGQTQAGCIDLVAGGMAYKAKPFAPDGERLWCDPDMVHDAARVYISQKADIDQYLNISTNKGVAAAVDRSCVGIKADGVRVVAREGIKLVTGTDVVNSQGGLSPVNDIYGIDLIALNQGDKLQPIPKGHALSEALVSLTDQVSKLNGIVHSMLQYQTYFNEQLTNHYHYAPAEVIPLGPPGLYIWKTSPSPPVVSAGITTTLNHLTQTYRSLLVQKANLEKFKVNYLFPAGDKYINSRFNNTN